MKLVCIPAYNEEKNIGRIIQQSKQYADKVIVCDDGSKDNTTKIAKENGVEVISHKKNLGKGGALRSLFNFSKSLGADVTVTIDADGQFLPEEIPKLMQPIIDGESDIVTGYRFGSNDDIPHFRKLGNQVLAKMTTTASGLKVRDAETGFRAYSKKAMEMIEFNSNTFGSDAEIIVNAARKGLRIIEVDVKVIYDTGGRTSTKNPVSVFAQMSTNLIELIAVAHPLKYLGVPGFILLIIGLFFSVFVISYFNETRIFSIPMTLIALGGFISGLMLLLMSAVLFSISRVKRY